MPLMSIHTEWMQLLYLALQLALHYIKLSLENGSIQQIQIECPLFPVAWYWHVYHIGV